MEIMDNHEAVYNVNNPDEVRLRQMDLFNNNLGIQSYIQIKSQVEHEIVGAYKAQIIANAISQKINSGLGLRLVNGILIITNNTGHCND